MQFSREPEALNQFFRAMVPDTGSIESDLLVAGTSAAVDSIGDTILMTHSHAGGFGWLSAMANDKIKAVISLEPGSGFVFPVGEAPETMNSSNGTLAPVEVEKSEFLKLTKMPIIIYYGDNIPTEPTAIQGMDNWRTRLAMAKLFVDKINEKGGDATLIHLPEIGIAGNTHFIMSDLNNLEIATHIESWIKETIK
ncbi:MAG: hypothetical protein ACI31W_08330 [Lactococcus sp.]